MTTEIENTGYRDTQNTNKTNPKSKNENIYLGEYLCRGEEEEEIGVGEGGRGLTLIKRLKETAFVFIKKRGDCLNLSSSDSGVGV